MRCGFSGRRTAGQSKIESSWDEADAEALADDPLQMRVYTSRLIGKEADLVLHGGGNTSVKAVVKDFFGDDVEVLYVKGSGWDLASIEAPGFAPVRLRALQRLARQPALTDSDMATQQRAALLDPHAPNPSVEAILHAIIPFKFVDHTHADAVVCLTNNPRGEACVRGVYGDKVLVVPYVMPGFVLARTILELTRDVDWRAYEGMVLMNHGIFTFGDDARTSYERMIRLVRRAEDYLEAQGALRFAVAEPKADLLTLAAMRKAISVVKVDDLPTHPKLTHPLGGGSYTALAVVRRKDATLFGTLGGPLYPIMVACHGSGSSFLRAEEDGEVSVPTLNPHCRTIQYHDRQA